MTEELRRDPPVRRPALRFLPGPRIAADWLTRVAAATSTGRGRARARLRGLGHAAATATWLHLALIVLVGAALRFWGILHGFADGFIYHPDTGRGLGDAWHQYLGASPLRRTRFGAAYLTLLGVLMWSLDSAARFLGSPLSWSFELIAAAASLLGATIGTATIPIVYLLGARAYGKATGLLAAALVSVDPLHSFHSHYPYRDVPMVFFLTVTLVACDAILKRPTAVRFLLGGVAAAITVALKPAGIVVVAPLGAAALLVSKRARALWLLLGVALLIGVDSALRPGRPSVGRFLFGFVRENSKFVLVGVPKALGLLHAWVGLPYLVVAVAAVGYALWRRRPIDLVLSAFLIPAFFAAAAFRWLDERFLVFLLPPAAVLVGRALVDAWTASRRARWARAGLGAVVAGLLLGALLQSAWQGILLSLPDTRALSGKWLEAHVPRTARVAMEGYHPLGVQEWPNATFFDPWQPLRSEAAKAEVLVTSSAEHQRYLDEPRRFRGVVPFFTALPQELQLIKSFSLVPLGFIHSDIKVYSTTSPSDPPPSRLLVPRPYDTTWNRGVTFLEPGPYDRDDRTLWLSGGHRYAATLVARVPPDEVVVFAVNGPEPSWIRVRVGWSSRTVRLAPRQWRAFRFRPSWLWPARPALYRFEVSLLPDARQALVQLRAGATDIGDAYARWGRWEQAARYLERAAAASPADPEPASLLARAYQRLGRTDAARRTVERLLGANPAAVDRYLSLGRGEIPSERWTAGFREVTGLDPALLTYALGHDLEAERLRPGTGRVVAAPEASAGLSLAFERGRDRPGVMLNGPDLLYLAQGPYRARFLLRAWDVARSGPVAMLKVFAETRLLASRAVTSRELAARPGFADIVVPFAHEEQGDRVAVEVETTGVASLAVDRVRIEPDLREAFRERASRLLLDATGSR